MTVFMVARTESEFLASLRNACIARTGVSRFAHKALCGCDARPTYCGRCGRDDFERPSETLTFTGTSFTCADCIDEINAASAAE